MKKNIVIVTLLIVLGFIVLLGLYQFDKLKAEYKSDLETLRSELQFVKEARQKDKKAYQDTLKELKKKQKKAVFEAEQTGYNNGYAEGKAQAKTIVKTVKTYQDPISADVTKNGVKVNYENETGYYLEGDQINRHEK